ncbi:MAG: hypothetical protein ABSG18_06930 [Steroidobacteraceae bacterium]|jgi:hypothetical protein
MREQQKLKTLAFYAGLLFAVTANAEYTARATLIGHHLNGYFGGTPLLICEYAGSRAKFEILSQNGKCAPYITVQ